MCKCFCCDKPMRDDEMVPVPFLRIVICKECDLASLDGRKEFPRPSYAKAWSKAVENRRQKQGVLR